MSFGSSTFGGAAEGVNGSSFGGASLGRSEGVDYGLGTGTVPGLQVGYDTSPGYSFNSGTTPGFNLGGYDIGGGLGYSSGNLSLGLGTDYSFSPDYGLSSLQAFGDLGQGMQATPTPGWSPDLGKSATTTAFSQQDDPGFWGSRAQKVMSFLAHLHPITALANGVAGVVNSPDPAKAAVQGLLGQFGLPGFAANTAYGAATSKDPAGYLGRTAAMTGVGMLGGALAGSAGAQLGREALGEGFRSSAVSEAATGPYGSASPMEAGFAQARAGAGSGGTQTASGGDGRNWTDTLMSIASGVYGMNQASQQRQTAQQAIAGSSPWTAQGGNAMAGQELQRVIRGDLANDPGFKLAQLSAARAGSQQPGGFAASAAANAALKYQMDRMQALGAPAGVGFNPAAGYQTALSGQQQANDLASKSLATIGYGVKDDQSGTMPPWLQKYLIDNKMGA